MSFLWLSIKCGDEYDVHMIWLFCKMTSNFMIFMNLMTPNYDKYILFKLLRIVLQYFDRIATDVKSSVISFVSVKIFENWNWHDFKPFSSNFYDLYYNWYFKWSYRL